MVVHPGNLLDIYSDNAWGEVPLQLFLQADVLPSSLYKFVEEYLGDVTVFSQTADDPVFLSRFSEVSSLLVHTKAELQRTIPWSESVRDLKAVLRAPK